MAYIASTGIYDGTKISQADHIERMEPHYGPLLRKIGGNPAISQRQLEPYDGGLTMDERNRWARVRCHLMAREACRQAIARWEGQVSDITHIILTTSTDPTAPTIDTLLVEDLQLLPTVRKLPIVMAGCAAGGIALQMAHDIVTSNRKCTCLVVGVESVASYMKEHKYTDINLAISTAIFSDGAAACIVAPTGKARIRCPVSYTVPGTPYDMMLRYEDGGLVPTLSPKIHLLTSGAMDKVLYQMPLTNLQGYLLHPGGKSILNEMEKLYPGQLKWSWDILDRYGNMSSASIFYVLDVALPTLQKGQYPVVTFGQGLHIAGILLEVE